MRNYMTVYDLNADELLELRYSYFEQLYGDEDFPDIREPEDIPEDVILHHYDGIVFVPEDFASNCDEDGSLGRLPYFY